MSEMHRQLAWAWLIDSGGLTIYPGAVECTVCGRPLTNVIGVISALLGIVGFVGQAGKSVEAEVYPYDRFRNYKELLLYLL